MTNTQRTWWIVAVAIILIVIVVLVTKDKAQAPYVEPGTQTQSAQQRLASTTVRLKSASLLMPDTLKEVTLVDGRVAVPATEGGMSMVEVMLADMSGAYTRIKDVHQGTAQARTDVLTVANISFGGTGLFSYLVLYRDVGAELDMRSIALIGDRIILKDITIDDLAGEAGEEYIVTVEYLDRAEGAPMASEPTVLKKKFFIVENGGFNLSKTDLDLVEEGKN